MEEGMAMDGTSTDGRMTEAELLVQGVSLLGAR